MYLDEEIDQHNIQMESLVENGPKQCKVMLQWIFIQIYKLFKLSICQCKHRLSRYSALIRLSLWP